MIKIALTGGIGTGKTYIARQFLAMGIPVYDADEETKKMYQTATVQALLRQTMGDDIFLDNQLNFKKMSQLCFSSPSMLQKLNALIHPRVMAHFDQWVLSQNSASVIMESAIVFEAGLASFFDKIFVVDAPLTLRINRIKQRNPDWTTAEIKQRIKSQMNQQEKCRRADLIIWNGTIR